jgi:integrase
VAYFDIKKINTRKKDRFKARVREKSKIAPKVSKTKTFDTFIVAETWAKETVIDLELLCSQNTNKPKALKEEILLFSNHKETPLTPLCTLNQYINLYLEHQKTTPNPISRTSIASLMIIKEHDLVRLPVSKITFIDLQTFCLERQTQCSPSTIKIDISNIMRVIREVAIIQDINISDQVVRQYYSQLKRDGLIADNLTRTRRLEKGESFSILKAFSRHDKKTNIKRNYPAIILLSISTTFRISELMPLTWGCIDFDKSEITVKNGKNTQRGTVGTNEQHRIAPLQFKAAQILQKIKPHNATDDMLIFNTKAKSFSSLFPQIMKEIGIIGLQQRDLRREGISILIEKGLSIEQIAQFTGHLDFNMIKNVYNRMNCKQMLMNNGICSRPTQ